MDRKKHIAARIKQARLDAGLSQRELGKLVGCTDVAISDIELAETNVDVPALERLAGILGRSLSWFFSDEVAPPARPLDVILKEAVDRLETIELVELPVWGTVPEEIPFIFEKEKIEYVQVPRAELEGISIQKLYAVKIDSDMFQAHGIFPGDFAVVNPNDNKPAGGKIYLVMGPESRLRYVVTMKKSFNPASLKAEVLGRVILSGRWKKH